MYDHTCAGHFETSDGKPVLMDVGDQERRRSDVRRSFTGARPRYNPGGQTTDYRFTGQRWQGDIGLYYYGARWYDHLIGRFAQADSIIPEPGNPQSLNRYAYSSNNPLRYTDPSDHVPICPGCITDVRLTLTAISASVKASRASVAVADRLHRDQVGGALVVQV